MYFCWILVSMFKCFSECFLCAYFALYQDPKPIFTSLQLVEYWAWAWVYCCLWYPISLFVYVCAYFLVYCLFSHFLPPIFLYHFAHSTEANSWVVLVTKAFNKVLVWAWACDSWLFTRPSSPSQSLSSSWACWGLFDKSNKVLLFAHSEQPIEKSMDLHHYHKPFISSYMI